MMNINKEKESVLKIRQKVCEKWFYLAVDVDLLFSELFFSECDYVGFMLVRRDAETISSALIDLDIDSDFAPFVSTLRGR